MNLKHTLILSFAVLLFMNCKYEDIKYTEEDMKDNPLVQVSTLPYGAPDFSKIKDKHFKPAIEYGLQLERQAIKEIVENSDEPTFENTIVALEKAGVVRSSVMRVFSALRSSNTNSTLTKLDAEMSPVLSQHYDGITLNDDLFQRVNTVYENKKLFDLNDEDARLLDVTYQNFIKAGANLSRNDKERLKSINSKLASLDNKFGQLLLDAGNEAALVIEDKDELDGLSQSEINSLKIEGGDGWKIPIQNTTQQPLNQALNNRDVREELFKRSWSRNEEGKYSTIDIIKQIVELRLQKARLLGYPNYAAWNLQDTMVKNTETVNDFFAELIPTTIEAAQQEEKVLQDKIKSEGENFDLKPWDWEYFAEKVRLEKYDLDEGQIKPYFELKSVLENGVFFAATKLFGITFEERTDIPTYHPDVLVYELFDEDGTPMGLFYGDYFKRDSKRGGAWMSNFVGQSHLLDTKPVIYNVCNYTKPAGGEAALLTFDNVVTTFHEFGHALHGFLSDQKYPSLSGTSVARDFVEYPSQANEHWVLEPEVLKNYARHYETGEQIPQTLINKIKEASTFNQGFTFGELLAAANLDFNYHQLEEMPEDFDANKFEKESLEKQGLWMENIPPRYRATYFNHIFASGYAAGYYAYLWTDMLALDTGKWFDENGGLTRENGQRYRDMILSRGNSLDYKEAYTKFRGQEPNADAILEAKGFK